MNKLPNQNIKDPIAAATYPLEMKIRELEMRLSAERMRSHSLLGTIHRAHEKIVTWDRNEPMTCKLCGASCAWDDPEPIKHHYTCVGHDMQMQMGWIQLGEEETDETSDA